MLAACERNAPLNAALFMLLHGEHDKRIRAVLLSLESVLLWLTELWVGGWGVWVVGWGEASYFVWWVGGWVAAPEGRMVVRWEGGLCVLKKLHAGQKWVVRKRTERWGGRGYAFERRSRFVKILRQNPNRKTGNGTQPKLDYEH